MLFANASPQSWQLVLGLVCIALAIWGTVRRLDVRLVLLAAAFALAALVGRAESINITFLNTFADEKFVIPICTAMGFAYVLKLTECDQHLVHLLVRPLRRVRFLLLPGTVLVGFLVNMPIVSQTSTAVTIGTVLIPVLLARIHKVAIGAALLLGSSVGGELYNPGAPEFITTITGSKKAATDLQKKVDDAEKAGAPSPLKVEGVNLRPETYTPAHCVRSLIGLNLLALGVATLSFWFLISRAFPMENEIRAGSVSDDPIQSSLTLPARNEEVPPFRVDPLKALVPIVPIVLLYLTSPMFDVYNVTKLHPNWFVSPERGGSADTRLIGVAMLVGCLVAGLANYRKFLGVADAFFQGAGYGFTHIISLIIIANCFGVGLQQIGLAEVLGRSIGDQPGLLMPLAGYLSLGFATLCGSGMATAQSLFGFFAEPALTQNIDPAHVGAVVSIASAAGRTMSPVAAVALMTAKMTDVSVFTLTKYVAVPLILSTTAVIVAAMIFAPAT